MSFIVNIPLKKAWRSLANTRMHHMAKHRMVKSQRVVVRLAFTSKRAALRSLAEQCALGGFEQPTQLRVKLTRISRGKLDEHDGLRDSFKATVDEIAAMAGVDDGDSLWRWEYAQEKGKPGIRIEVGG
jgi:hypothetical protein